MAPWRPGRSYPPNTPLRFIPTTPHATGDPMAHALRLSLSHPPLPYSGEGRGGGSHAAPQTAPSLTLPRNTGRGDRIRLPFLPGRFVIERGSLADYHALARF